MAQGSATADKNIVDLTRAHRNREVAQAVRRTRDRLTQAGGNVVYDRELLKLHARSLRSGLRFLPPVVLAVAGGGFFAGMGPDVLLWATLTILGYCGLFVLARRTDAAESAEIDSLRVSQQFLVAHAVSGIGWACFAVFGCRACGIAQFPEVKAAVLLAVMAGTALHVSALRSALALNFAPPIAAFALSSVQFGEVSDVAMLLLLVAALPFLVFVCGFMNGTAVMLLSFQNEKDGLIAELETQKGISDEARRRAEEANLAKSRFLASMSHELRTPLNAILGFSEVMSAEVLGPMQNATYREYARDIHDSGKHLLDLINEILDLSRIEAGRYQLNEEPTSVADSVEDACRMMELRARTKDIRIVQNFERQLPLLFADGRAIRQIALNLLSNAVKFTPTGGEIEVRVGWTAGGGQYVSVRDNGPGIPPEEIPVVLSAFGQGAIAIKSAEQGTGLGLPIVQGLAAIHGGTFELRSKLRQGTEAVAIFPAARVMEELPAVPVRVGGPRR